MPDLAGHSLTPPLAKGLRGTRSLIIVVTSVLLGLLGSYLLAPEAFRALPTDLVRTRILLGKLNEGQLNPEIAVFGSSVAMNGVDARQVRREMTGEPLTLNLSSSGQTIAESMLYYQFLPESVKTVVHVVIPETLVTDECMRQDKYNAFYMYGYRPTNATRRVVGSACGERMRKLFGASRLEQTFNSRWAVHQAVDAFLWKSLRKGVDVRQVTSDLYFPAFQPVLSPQERAFSLRNYLVPQPGNPRFRLPQQETDALRGAVELNRKAGRRTVLVFAPVHPQMQRYYGSQFLEDVHQLMVDNQIDADLTVIDHSTDASEGDFVDRLHLAQSGAEKFSHALANDLAALQP